MEVRPDRWNETQFFPSSGRIDTAVWMHYVDANWMYGEKAWRQLHKDATNYVKEFQEVTSLKTAAVRPPTTHLEDHPN